MRYGVLAVSIALMFHALPVAAQEGTAAPAAPAVAEAAPAAPAAATPSAETAEAAPAAPAEDAAEGDKAAEDKKFADPENLDMPPELVQENPGWDVSWRDFVGKVQTFSEKELPQKMEFANQKESQDKKKIAAMADVQFILGYMYQYGEGVQQPDDMMAQKWYNKSAKNKNSKAMVALGEFYYGYGDAGLAAKWFSRAAEAGEPYANYKIGEIYEYGYGEVMAKPEKAFKHYSDAASGGIENAWLKLGQFYQYGFGAPMDMNKAIEYYKKLLNTENKTRKAQVQYMLSEVYALIAEQKSGKERMEWLEKSAEIGNLRSIVRMADLYADENGADKNVPAAIKWYQNAADLGDIYSMVKLGYIYSNGTVDLDPDYCKAYDYYFKAAEKGSKEAMYNLGSFYYSGYCQPQDYEKANMWWQRSAGH